MTVKRWLGSGGAQWGEVDRWLEGSRGAQCGGKSMIGSFRGCTMGGWIDDWKVPGVHNGGGWIDDWKVPGVHNGGAEVYSIT